MEIFENNTPTRDYTSLMNAIIAELANKFFLSRAKGCLVGLKRVLLDEEHRKNPWH